MNSNGVPNVLSASRWQASQLNRSFNPTGVISSGETPEARWKN